MRTLMRLFFLGIAAAAALISGSAAAELPRPAEAPAAPEFAVRLSGETRVVDYKTVTLYSDELYSDESEVISEGRSGIYLDRIRSVYLGDELISTAVTSTVTVSEPEDRVILAGSLPGSRSDSRGYFIWPVDGVVTSRFGRRSTSVGSSDHKGLDIGAPEGTPVAAADSGEVIFAGEQSGYGRLVKLLHDDGTVTLYAHLSSVSVSEGDRLTQGDKLGEVGMTGVATGPHLHFEVREGGVEAADPLPLLPERY